MDFYYHTTILIPIFLLVSAAFSLISSTTSSTSFPIAKPGCEGYCGDVSIPFPFGTREGCYLNQHFLVQCNSSSNDVDPPTSFLWQSTLEITDISLEGQLRILNYMGYDCYSQKNDTRSDYFNSWMTIPKPFLFNSTVNKFTAVGCDTYAIVKGVSNKRTYTTGCMSICDEEGDVEDGPCSGIGCCQTSIPNGAWKINVTLSSYNNHSYVSSFSPCSYGFVIEEAAFEFFADNLTNIDKYSRVPVVVDWVVAYETCEEAKNNLTSYACKENSACYQQNGALGYRCRCKEGFEGNPYLPANGCRDIDECGNSTLNYCANNSTCVNMFGNYTCKCNPGYHGDGRKNGEGCIADQLPHKRNYWSIFAVIGVSTGSAILLAFSLCFYSRLMKTKTNREKKELFKKNGGSLLLQKLTCQGGGTYTTKIFTIEELQQATNNFDQSQIIGRGGFGTVFKGVLIDKTEVAIKRSIGVNQHQVEQFINELIVLSQINNRNVVKLLGCCLETEVPFLVYEFIDNGTLFAHLHNKIKALKLSWSIRLRIASEIAGVLSYLHSVASPPIIHRDIKSDNVLLDQNYTAKVSDFGISKFIPMDENQVSTVVQGTHGYLDPEYFQTGMLTEKSDVYSFGVVLVELLTGKKVFATDRPEAERFLSHHFLRSLKENKLVQVFDSNISYNENLELLKEVAVIAEKCISVKGEDRPCMKDVARELEALGVKAQKFLVHQTFEIDVNESEALLGMKSKCYGSWNDATPSPRDLYPVCPNSTTTTEQISIPIEK